MEFFHADMQTMALYAEILDQMQIYEATRSIATLKGSFTTRGGYVYFQTYDPGRQLRQLYVGKEGEHTARLIEEYTQGKVATAETEEILKRLSTQVRAGFGVETDRAMMRVLHSLADAGVFRSGGVLIGTHAFYAIGTMLGTRWPAMFTEDIDVAGTIAMPEIEADIPATIDALKMGFFPVPRLNNKEPSTSYAVRGSKLRLDIVTPQTQEATDPVNIRRFGCAALPLPYLGYLIENPVQAVLLDTMPILVNVPQPARYACHKLIVSQVRDISAEAKATKDIHQAFLLMAFLQEIRPANLQEAWDILISKGPKWRRHATAALRIIEQRYGFRPELKNL